MSTIIQINPWVEYGDETLFIPRTSRERLAADPIQEKRYSARCIYKCQSPDATLIFNGRIITREEMDELCCCDLELIRKEFFGEWMRRIVAKLKALRGQ